MQENPSVPTPEIITYSVSELSLPVVLATPNSQQ